MKRIIALVLAVLLLGAGVWYVRRTEQLDQQHMRELYTKVEPLQQKKEALQTERDGLSDEYSNLMRDVSTVQLLFRDMDTRVFSDIYPLMRDRGITGVLGVSKNELPLGHKKLSAEQYNRLLMDGWGSCILYDRAEDLNYFLTSLQQKLTQMQLALPTAIYFPNDTYSQELDEVLLAFGINTVVLDASDGHSATITAIDQLWHVGAMPWNYTGVNSDLELLARTNGGNLTFTVSFANLWDAYDAPTFTRMLDDMEAVLVKENLLDGLVEPTPVPTQDSTTAVTETITPLLKVTDFDTARASHDETRTNNALLEREYQKRLTALETEIAELDQQISEIYADWNAKTKK